MNSRSASVTRLHGPFVVTTSAVLVFFRVLQQGVCLCNVSASQGSGLASHTVSTQGGCHMLLTTSMCPHLAKNTQILDENGHFHKTSHLTRASKNQHGHKNASFLEKKCTLNAEGPNLACRWKPDLACQGCQARLSSFSGQKAPNSTEHPVHNSGSLLYSFTLRLDDLQCCSSAAMSCDTS